MDGFFAAVVAVWLAFIMFLVITSSSHYTPQQVRDACISHHGVQQVEDTTWSGGDGAAIIVCRDGYVTNVQ